MGKVPSAIWIVDTKKEHLAVDEARKLGVPVVAILDTNCDPDDIDHPIPGNDDAIRSVSLLTRAVADAVAAGLLERSGGEAAGAAGDAEPLAECARERLATTGADRTRPVSKAAAEAEGPAEAASIDEAAAETAPTSDSAGAVGAQETEPS